MRLCTICKRTDKETIFGRDVRCLECNRKRRSIEYRTNPQKERDKSLKRYYANREELLLKNKLYLQKVKDEVFTHYGGYICNCCGETERMFLTIDHIHGNGNEHRRSVKGAGSYICPWIRANGFPEDMFQVLCYNCNLAKAKNNNICPHKNQK